jgi:hypothetical protein
MAKTHKDVPLAVLIAPDLNVVDQSAKAIHDKGSQLKSKRKKKAEKIDKPVVVESTVRVTVDTPQSWHKAIKLHKIQHDDTDSIRQFYLDAVEAHCKKLGIELK